jgi:hypothetical protein
LLSAPWFLAILAAATAAATTKFEAIGYEANAFF